MRYSIEPRERRYVKGYGFLSFARNLNNKYGQNLVDSAKKSATDAFKIANKRAIQKTAEATGYLVGNTIASKITIISKEPQVNHTQMWLTMKYQKKDTYVHKKDNNIIIEYEKIENLLGDASNKTSKFKTRKWIEINDDSIGTYNPGSQIKFKTTMLKSSLCDYSDAYIHVKGTITVNNNAVADSYANNSNKKGIFKNCALFTNCINEINNIDLGNAKDIDIVMPMYNLIECGDNYSKTSGSLWQYTKDIPAVNNDNAIVDFTSNNLTDSFNFKVKMTGQTGDNGTKNVEIMVPLKYLSNFRRTLEMPLINCEITLLLIWSVSCVIVSTDIANQNVTFAITDTKLYVLVVILSQQDHEKLLEQLQSGFERVINWNKYLSKPELLSQNPNLNHLIEPSFQGINRLFVLAF